MAKVGWCQGVLEKLGSLGTQESELTMFRLHWEPGRPRKSAVAVIEIFSTALTPFLVIQVPCYPCFALSMTVFGHEENT